MRVVFMGTPDIAATCLTCLCGTKLQPVAVYTKPDMPKNRGMKMAMSEVKEVALAHSIPVYQPTTFKDDGVYEELKALKPDVIAVVAYGKILPQRVLDIPKFGCINIHASILPELRGAGPVQWAILNGMKETGVTGMYMDAGMDTGDIIEIRRTPIDPEENAQQLLDRLAVMGGELLVELLGRLAQGEALPRTPQDSSKATMAPMLSKALCPINWAKSAHEIHDQIRGLDPWPVATAMLGGKRFKIYRAVETGKDSAAAPGTILGLTKTGAEIVCGDGKTIEITTLQAEGGKRMVAPDYFRGHPLPEQAQ